MRVFTIKFIVNALIVVTIEVVFIDAQLAVRWEVFVMEFVENFFTAIIATDYVVFTIIDFASWVIVAAIEVVDFVLFNFRVAIFRIVVQKSLQPQTNCHFLIYE